MKKNKILETNELSSEAKASMKTRIITALILAAIVAPCLFLGGWFYFALTVVFTVFVSYELIHILNLKTKIKYFAYVAAIILTLAFVYWIFVKNNLIDKEILWDTVLTNNFSNLEVSIILILIAAGIFFSFAFASEEFDVGKTMYSISMIVIIGLCVQSLLYLRYSPFNLFSEVGTNITTPIFKYLQSSLLVVFVILGTICNDIGAYFVGVLFGKRKVNPRISPNKTWEGFFGGIVFSFIISFSFAFIFSAVNLPILPNLDINHWYWVFIISFILPIIANLGDFAFSALKRNFHVKDFSRLLPGHGGLLDRADSLLFTSAFTAAILIFINNGWNLLK